ncbi:Protein of unknown function [Paenibacillus sp. UNC496MF]|uniref:DUF3891 family protein n=1 Tax=Paenibacillus sp. UNC496MF TaxID=1502753 RepID=UPI0008EA251D|nr:DUF3891 family protein [Paenibacillus sp. UNC496MF]SFJ86080.1 Protein of unknown function [Paenibacillus sp. UNC496MF]
MIIRETEQAYVMTHQHEHARLSGDIAKRFHAHLFLGEERREDALHAVYEHDRAWINMDDTPIWNDGSGAPYSFMDYPLRPKLLCYRDGIDETERGNAYAALLCSLHYANFEAIRTSDQPEMMAFRQHELERQARIRAALAPLEEATVQRHLRILRLCDGLSLYVCLNEPGADKAREHPWYRAGFDTPLVAGEQYVAHWASPREIGVAPSLFAETFTASVRQKQVPKTLIAELGLHAAFDRTAWTEQQATFLAEMN